MSGVEQIDGLLEVVGAVGQDAAIELRLIGRKLVELRGHAKVLVIGEQVLQAGIGVEAARGSGLQLRTGAGLLLLRRAIGVRKRAAGVRPAGQIAVRVAVRPAARIAAAWVLAHSAGQRAGTRTERARMREPAWRWVRLALRTVSRGAGCFVPQVHVTQFMFNSKLTDFLGTVEHGR